MKELKEMTEFESKLLDDLYTWWKLADEAVGSWHRFVDAVEEIANKMEDKS